MKLVLLCLVSAAPALAAYPPAYLCKKKLDDWRPWVCGNWKYKCRYGVTTDGCSVPKGFIKKTLRAYSRKFRKACEAHDVCYRLGKSKKQCDRAFLRAMTRTCGRFPTKPCLATAQAYYAEVALASRHKASWKSAQAWKKRKTKSGKKFCVAL